MTLAPLNTQVLLDELVPLIRRAADRVLEVYATDFEVLYKDEAGAAAGRASYDEPSLFDPPRERSPVTLADQRAEALILEGLAALTPGIPVVAEEAASAGNVPEVGARFWLVDALDGTREFVRRNGEFTVNIALIEHGRPVLGLVLLPTLGRLFCGVDNRGAWMEDADGRRDIATRAVPEAGLTVVTSRSHTDFSALDPLLKGLPVAVHSHAGSSLKLCLLAAGRADAYPRLGRTMEWDIAAGDAVLRAAGGCLQTLDGTPMVYGKPGFENPHFVAWGKGMT